VLFVKRKAASVLVDLVEGQRQRSRAKKGEQLDQLAPPRGLLKLREERHLDADRNPRNSFGDAHRNHETHSEMNKEKDAPAHLPIGLVTEGSKRKDRRF
jgi:hypothetical protein